MADQITPGGGPGFAMSPSHNYPLFTSNGVDIGPHTNAAGYGGGPNPFSNPSTFNGHFMNPYAWPNGGVDQAGNGGVSGSQSPNGLSPFNQENQPAPPGNGGPQLGNPGIGVKRS